MDIVANQKQISSAEKAQINRQVQAELVEHLFRGCLPGTIAGIPVGIAIFVTFVGYASFSLLIAWSIYYCLALSGLTIVYLLYKKYQSKFDLSKWLLFYSIAMSLCAVAWGFSVLLIPESNMIRQFIAFIALMMFATGYATGSIGVFELCVITLSIILLPLVAWCFLKGSFLYNLVGAFSIIYLAFLISINKRSTEWFIDSLKLKLENNLVSYQANHDLLTGLPNQRLLPQSVETAINAFKDKEDTFALVCFSLNRMEMINDSLGHQIGNSIIQTVASRLTALAQQLVKALPGTQYNISISRQDTFNLLISPLTPDTAEEQIKQFFSVLDEPFYLEQKGVKMTASMGVSLFKKDGADLQSLLANADAAMLTAKQIGGNRLEFYRAEINSQLPKQIELEADLHQALKNKELELFYQPLVDLATNQVNGMEALLRWKHPVNGYVSPMNFIPLAEQTGLIIPIGEWILEEACRQTKLWHDMGYTSLRVAVNVSGKQLHQKNIIQMIQDTLKRTQFDVNFLELEITETAILEESVIHLIQEFKKIGVRLAVDDFGTGYSGLSYLKRFSIDKLKIDQSFIRDIPGSNDSITIVSAIIAMGRELNVKTLAEGVETQEQLDFLREKGCNYIQGYYYSKPVNAESFTQLLIKYRNGAVGASQS